MRPAAYAAVVSLARAGLVAVIGAIVAGRLAVVSAAVGAVTVIVVAMSAAVGAITVIVTAMPAAVRVIIGTVSGFSVCPTIATVTHVSHGALIIIMSGTVVIANGEVPATIEPFYRAQEIVDCGIEPVLRFFEYVVKVVVAVGPICAVGLRFTVDAEEIIEIGLINLLILPTIEAEFISHLVCEIKSLLACHAVRHCAKSKREAYGKNQCVKSAFHGCKF
mgnify:FL=1